MRPFPVEDAYRTRFYRGLFDLSSSSPRPLAPRELLDMARMEPARLLDAPLEYEPSGGSAELRAAVAALYAGLSADDVLITTGAGEAILVALTAAVEPGDAVVAQRPSYDALREVARARGAQVLDWAPSDGWQFDFARLPAGAERASAIVCNNPHGPSGSIARGAPSEHVRLIADEVYRPAALVPGTSVRAAAEVDARAVSIGDLSKPLGLGGLRVGWIASRDRDFIERCGRVLDYASGSISSLSARLGLIALRHFDALLERHLAVARRNLAALAVFVEQHGRRFEWCPPQAGYTAFLRRRNPGFGAELRDRLRARGIFLLDGAVFEAADHLRVGFGHAPEAFDAALATLSEELGACEGAPDVDRATEGDVIVLAKAPLPGYAKTRLAAGVGAETGAELARAFLLDSLALASDRARRLYVSFAPATSRELFERMAPDARPIVQPDGDLGARLLHAFETGLGDGAERPVLIGGDSPTLPSHLLSVGQHALRTHDVVLGPAEDGGYYLIGMRRPHRALFEGIDWSGADVLAQTLQRAQRAGLSVFMLPYWYDVDTSDGLDRLASDPLLRSETRAALAAMRAAEVAP